MKSDCLIISTDLIVLDGDISYSFKDFIVLLMSHVSEELRDGTEVIFECGYDDGERGKFTVRHIRYETNEEMENRILSARRYHEDTLKRVAERERADYERLRKKFEK